MFATAAAIHFAVRYPVDYYGVVKGVYLQFAAPPMYALFGVATAWSARRRIRWPLLVPLLGSLWLIAAYTLYCRMRVPVIPLPSFSRSGNLAVNQPTVAPPGAFGTQPGGAVDGERFGQFGYHSDREVTARRVVGETSP